MTAIQTSCKPRVILRSCPSFKEGIVVVFPFGYFVFIYILFKHICRLFHCWYLLFLSRRGFWNLWAFYKLPASLFELPPTPRNAHVLLASLPRKDCSRQIMVLSPFRVRGHVSFDLILSHILHHACYAIPGTLCCSLLSSTFLPCCLLNRLLNPISTFASCYGQSTSKNPGSRS